MCSNNLKDHIKNNYNSISCVYRWYGRGQWVIYPCDSWGQRGWWSPTAEPYQSGNLRGPSRGREKGEKEEDHHWSRFVIYLYLSKIGTFNSTYKANKIHKYLFQVLLGGCILFWLDYLIVNSFLIYLICFRCGRIHC